MHPNNTSAADHNHVFLEDVTTDCTDHELQQLQQLQRSKPEPERTRETTRRDESKQFSRRRDRSVGNPPLGGRFALRHAGSQNTTPGNTRVADAPCVEERNDYDGCKAVGHAIKETEEET